MAEIIYAQPDFTRNARIQGDAKEERNVGLDENTADNVIYDNVAVVVAASEKLQKPTEDKLQGADKAITGLEKRTPSRAAAVCLGLLTVLLLAAIVGLVIHYSNWEVEKSLLLERNANLSGEANKLKSENDNLTQRISQSEEETAHLQAVSNNTIKALQEIIKELKEMVNERDCCPQGWETFENHCYKPFQSSPNKNWTESKKDCEDRRANLVIIKSKEEQAFIKSKGWKGWIGLALDNGKAWKWVDGSPLKDNEYWDDNPKQPSNSTGDEDCVEIYTNNLKWNDAPCNNTRQWICQK